jgi:hypothetical protein
VEIAHVCCPPENSQRFCFGLALGGTQ